MTRPQIGPGLMRWMPYFLIAGLLCWAGIFYGIWRLIHR